MIPGWRLLLDQLIESRKRLLKRNQQTGDTASAFTPLVSTLTLVEQNLDFISAISSQILLIERGVISQRVSTSEKSELELLRKKLTV